MNIENKMQDIIFKEIEKKDFKVFLFWSRAIWNYKYNSDYDIWIMWKTPLEYKKFLKLKRILNELPVIVDLVDFNKTDNDFKELALKKIISWN